MMATEKAATPAYGSIKSFNTFFNSMRDSGHNVDVVDKTLMPTFSGSTTNELLATLKFLRLIGEKGEPLEYYEQYVVATDEERKLLLAQLVKDAYGFVFNSQTYNVERATSGTTAELFRTQGINGSTLSRAISFFLAAAAQAGIKVSANIKAPPVTKSTATRTRRATPAAGQQQADDDGVEVGDDDGAEEPGVMKFEIPIPIDRKVKITIPSDFSTADWTLLQAMFTAYVQRWQAMDKEKDKGPAPAKE